MEEQYIMGNLFWTFYTKYPETEVNLPCAIHFRLLEQLKSNIKIHLRSSAYALGTDKHPLI